MSETGLVSGFADLSGKVVVVTGARGGLGAALAAAIEAQGGQVVATDLEAPEAGDGTEGRCELALDVTSRAAWDEVVSTTLAHYGRIDGLVNNAGLCRYAAFEETTPELLTAHLAVNLYGPLHGMQAIVPHLPRGGSVVNIASIAGLYGWPRATAYAASKFALRGLTRAAAAEFGERGIRVNAICPGAVDTAMLSDQARAGGGVVAAVPLARAGLPGEIASMAVFLLSEAASYCTGQDFLVDGGMKA